MNCTHTRLAVLVALSALALVACGGSSTESPVGPGADAATLAAADTAGPEAQAGDSVCDGCDGTGTGPGPGDGTCDGCDGTCDGVCDGTGDGPGPGDGTCDGCDCTCDGSECTCACPCDGCKCTCDGITCICECACDGTGPHGPNH